MDDEQILDHIGALVREERALRDREGALSDEERVRLRALEVQLDQCWDLLRQRRAKSEFGEDPDSAATRPPGEVEGYLS
ncbi:DUF2630 family protein [Streptomyces ficellus]|uniref:DUF2630 family protein n=1 Tax=Streptomyces ficellus TaxID=1977088 RepID=A0ABT7ZEN2_9ACTN|nr:DUF2630 family protein [Streptomyces ficellus]MDN3297717.1 DUF2630 family protein [Streptomyces ficellus]